MLRQGASACNTGGTLDSEDEGLVCSVVKPLKEISIDVKWNQLPVDALES